MRGNPPTREDCGTGLSHEAAKLSAGGITGEHGFLTDAGQFVSRRRAGEIALASGQANELANPDLGLSSSDLSAIIRPTIETHEYKGDFKK